MQKKVDELESGRKIGNPNDGMIEGPKILKYLISQEGLISKMCQNQHKNQLYIEFLAVSIFKEGKSQFFNIAYTADYLRRVA
jgi:hypothetical protein